MKTLRAALSTFLCVASVAVSFAASGDPPKALPGADIDLRTATAVADQIVVGTISGVGTSRLLSGQSGMHYEDVTVDVAQTLKGDQLSQITCFVGTPDQTGEGNKLPPQQLPTSGRYVLFVSRQAAGNLSHGFKLEPATPQVIRQIKLYSWQLPTTRQLERETSQAATRPVDLIAEIILPDAIPAGHSLHAKLRLTNRSAAAIRICTLGQCWCSGDLEGRHSDLILTPGEFKSDTPPLVEFAKCVKAIDPEQSFNVPIDFYLGDGPGQIRLTAQYSARAEIARKLDIWAGSVSAGPVTVKR